MFPVAIMLANSFTVCPANSPVKSAAVIVPWASTPLNVPGMVVGDWFLG